MKKRVALVAACVLFAAGLYSAISSNQNRSSNGSSQRADEAPKVDAEKVAEILASAVTSKNLAAPLANNAHEPDLDVALDHARESLSEIKEQRPNLDPIEDVDEQVRLALDMGYINENQVEEFRQQREGLNTLRRAQAEAEMTEQVQGGVVP